MSLYIVNLPKESWTSVSPRWIIVIRDNNLSSKSVRGFIVDGPPPVPVKEISRRRDFRFVLILNSL